MVGITAALGIAGAIGGAAISSSGANKAANATQYAADQSAAVQREIYGQNKEMLAPWVLEGAKATPVINGLLGLGDAQQAQQAFDTYRGSTGYDFRLKQGLNAVTSGYAGGGMLRSGAAMKGLADYGQGMATQEFGNYMGALGNQQSMGLAAAGNLAGVSSGYANSLGSIYQQNGANQANAALVKSQNTANALGGIAGIAGNAFGSSGGGGFNSGGLNAMMTGYNPAASGLNYNALSSSNWRDWGY